MDLAVPEEVLRACSGRAIRKHSSLDGLVISWSRDLNRRRER